MKLAFQTADIYEIPDIYLETFLDFFRISVQQDNKMCIEHAAWRGGVASCHRLHARSVFTYDLRVQIYRTSLTSTSGRSARAHVRALSLFVYKYYAFYI